MKPFKESHDTSHCNKLGLNLRQVISLKKLDHTVSVDWSNTHLSGPIDHTASSIDWEGRKMHGIMQPEPPKQRPKSPGLKNPYR